MGKYVLSLLVSLTLIGCVHMSGQEKIQYNKLQMELKETNLPELKEKDPATAGVLNLFIGIGNAYLDQWGIFAINFLLWPASIVWGIPQAATDASTINKKQTLYHYSFGLVEKQLE